ncbi:MAG: hypothetical protein P0Y55_12175 [Candidatus Cohnella colombiensis]|uniref:Uncharacterized protein n=1 Tax=Candidatus Cohnella colombiensis TaxID=3121368 RepID=A0AA95EUK9_9BACL|nr:MAG: hypothetical protein P0Y55_12175 [Cohnella sp.]
MSELRNKRVGADSGNRTSHRQLGRLRRNLYAISAYQLWVMGLTPMNSDPQIAACLK